MRTVLVGCGSISGSWLAAAKRIDAVELVGLVDLDEEAALARARKYDLDLPTGSDLAAMLAATRAELVFDCTVPSAHHAVTLTALRYGSHVFGEKPLADTLEQARELVRVAAEVERTFAVMQNRRFNPNLRALREFVRGGAIGEPTTVNSDFYLGAHFGGFRQRMAHVLLKDMAIHTFDAARFLTGADPVAVSCHEWNPAGSWYERDASAMAIFELAGGLVYSYRGSWCAEGVQTSWEARWHLVGTRGSLVWDGADGLTCQVAGEDEGLLRGARDVAGPPLEAEPSAPGSGPSTHERAIRAFVEAVERGEAPETVASDNIASLAMVLGAVESAETGRRVAIDPFGAGVGAR